MFCLGAGTDDGKSHERTGDSVRRQEARGFLKIPADRPHFHMSCLGLRAAREGGKLKAPIYLYVQSLCGTYSHVPCPG